jgi:hypothetical protein
MVAVVQVGSFDLKKIRRVTYKQLMFVCVGFKDSGIKKILQAVAGQKI